MSDLLLGTLKAPTALIFTLALGGAASLSGCGGGDSEVVAPKATTGVQTEQQQAALNRAMRANADALSRVKGERATPQE